MQKYLKKKWIVLSAALIIFILVITIFPFKLDKKTELPSAEIKFGDFLIELSSSGEIKAAQSINVSAPRVRVNLQIVKLVPEGAIVDSGDFLIQFDTNELQKEIDDKQSELEIAIANLDKSRASMQANMTQLQSSWENSQASFQLANLRLEQMAFEAEVRVQEERLRLRQAEISLQQDSSRIESQKLMDAAELTTYELKIKQAQSELDKARIQLEQLTVTAPAPGLVVYQKIWTGSDMEKIKVGDTPWRGQALIQLPDLSNMQVLCEISEVEIGKLKTGQAVSIKLDAFPDPTFAGSVKDIASLAHEKEGQEGVKVFDLLIDIKGSDPILKPGMTAKAKILIETVPQVFSIPIEAVFDRGEDKVVYLTEKGGKPIKVSPKQRNENFVVVESDLKAGQLVSLVDPQKPVEKEKTVKEQSSPELPNAVSNDTQSEKKRGKSKKN